MKTENNDVIFIKEEMKKMRDELESLNQSRRRTFLSLGFKKALLVVLAFATPIFIYSAVTKPFNFGTGDVIYASKINANFDAVYAAVNNSVPVGTIVAWHKDLAAVSLPDGWVTCDGQLLNDPQSPYNTKTIPNLNADARFLRGSATSGTMQDDAFQGHYHNTVNILYAVGAGGTLAVTIGTNTQQGGTITSPITDGTNGAPKTASETRPKNMSVVWIMKVK